MQRPVLRHPRSSLAPFLSGAVYFFAASLTLLTSRFDGGLAFIWIANAFLLAELLTSRPFSWIATLAACAVASALATTLFGMGPVAAVPMAVINMVESLIVAILYRRLVPGRTVMGSMRSLAAFVFALGGVADIVTAAAAAAVAAKVVATPYTLAFVQWYSGHVLGGLTCTPILLMFLQGEVRRWMSETSPRLRLEAVGLLLLFAVLAWAVFYQSRYPLLFVPLLPIVVIAFRVGHLGAAMSVVILGIIGASATIAGVGPLSLIAGSTGERTQFFQLYLAFSFLMSMPIAAELNGRRRLFRLLQESETRYRLMAEHSGDVVFDLSVDGTIRYASAASEEQIGLAPELLVGRSAVTLVDPQDRPIVIAAHRRALERPGTVQTVEFRPALSAVGCDWCEMVIRAVLDERGLPTGVVSTIRDMTRHKARQQALQQVAAVDELTGADTRRAFLEKLETEMRRTRQGGRSCLLLLDLDHFKAINDRHGHGAGDRVLAAFVERLRCGLRGIDSIGRLGGEEFAVLLSDSDIRRASTLCERLRRAVAAEPMAIGDGEAITVTFSAGLVELEGDSASAALEAADKALYRAKHSGRNCLRLAA